MGMSKLARDCLECLRKEGKSDMPIALFKWHTAKMKNVGVGTIASIEGPLVTFKDPIEGTRPLYYWLRWFNHRNTLLNYTDILNSHEVAAVNNSRDIQLSRA